MTNAERAALYLDAAENIEADRNTYSCCAIIYSWDCIIVYSWDCIIPDPRIFARDAYSARFCPVEGQDHGFWLDDAGIDPFDRKEFRLTALCLAAAMARTGDL